MADSPDQERGMPPPLPGPEAAARRARGPATVDGNVESSQARSVLESILIGLVSVLFWAAIPIIIVIILAFVAQLMISGSGH